MIIELNKNLEHELEELSKEKNCTIKEMLEESVTEYVEHLYDIKLIKETEAFENEHSMKYYTHDEIMKKVYNEDKFPIEKNYNSTQMKIVIQNPNGSINRSKYSSMIIKEFKFPAKVVSRIQLKNTSGKTVYDTNKHDMGIVAIIDTEEVDIKLSPLENLYSLFKMIKERFQSST